VAARDSGRRSARPGRRRAGRRSGVGEGLLIGAVQMEGVGLAPRANPYHKQFDLDALDEHVRATTDKALRMFERAGRKGLDLVLGGEDMQHVAGVMPLPPPLNLLRRYSQPVPGPLCERIAAVARRYNMYTAACFFERAGGRYYNTAVMFDGNGRLVGKYRKVHLPPQEACVLTPGRELPVFRTELGKVGFMICYDIMFPETARCLALRGAELLCHPTAGYGWTEPIGDVQLRARAVDNDVSIVVSCTQRSQVVNFWGDVLADAGRRKDVIVHARLDPRQPRRFAPGHAHRELTGIAQVRGELFRERRPAVYRALTAPVPEILAARKGRIEIYTARRKAAIRKLLAEQWKARAAQRPESLHWEARRS